jgi:hypothetical protein
MNSYRMQRCIEIARSLSDCRTGRSLHFSFILDKNRLLVTGVNSYEKLHRTHVFGDYRPIKHRSTNYIAGQHSECHALRIFINKFGHVDCSGLTLYNVRIGYKGEVMMAKPCGNCQRVVDSCNFKRILWTE